MSGHTMSSSEESSSETPGNDTLLLESHVDISSADESFDEAPSNPTSAIVKTEVIDTETADKSVNAHLLTQLAEAKQLAEAARIEGELLQSKLDTASSHAPSIAHRKRKLFAENNLIELLDIDSPTFDIESPDFNYSTLSAPSHMAKYTSAAPTKLPEPPIVATADIKTEQVEPPTNKDPLATSPRPGKKKKKSSAKLPISPEFVDTIDSTFTSQPDEDHDPHSASKVFRNHFMLPGRRKALITWASTLHPDGPIIFSDAEDCQAKLARQQLIESVRKTLQDNPSQPQDDFLEIMSNLAHSPESFFSINRLFSILEKAGISSPKEAAELIRFDPEILKSVIIDINQVEPEETPGEDDATTESDSRLATSRSSLFTGSSFSSFCSSYTRPSFPSIPSTPLPSSTPVPAFTSTPASNSRRNLSFANTTPQPGPFQHSTPGLITPPATPNTPSLYTTLDQHMAQHRIASRFLSEIISYPPSHRLTISKWNAHFLSHPNETPPTPTDYHPRFSTNPTFLDSSFRGEALPGVFRPSNSGLSEKEASDAFTTTHRHTPNSLIQLNNWIMETYPPTNPPFDPSLHSPHLDGFDMSFYGQVASLSLSNFGADKKPHPNACPHKIHDRLSARAFLMSFHDTHKSLSRFLACPELTTIGPSFSTREAFFGFSIPHPTRGGHLVAKPVLFEHNSFSFSNISNQSKCSRCAICGGLLLLPDHITFLTFWWPPGLSTETVTSAMLKAWDAQNIAVCYIHFQTDGIFIPGRKLHNISPGL